MSTKEWDIKKEKAKIEYNMTEVFMNTHGLDDCLSALYGVFRHHKKFPIEAFREGTGQRKFITKQVANRIGRKVDTMCLLWDEISEDLDVIWDSLEGEKDVC